MSSPQTSQRGRRKRVIPLHYQKKNSLNQSHRNSGRSKPTLCDLSDNNRSLALALQDARIELARKNDQITNFQRLGTQVELSISVIEKALSDLKDALKETYDRSRHSANDDTGHGLHVNKTAEEEPPSTDTSKKMLLNVHNVPTFPKNAKVQDVLDIAARNSNWSKGNLRFIGTISESPEKVDFFPKAPKVMLSKIPTLNAPSQKSTLKRKNTETLTAEEYHCKGISKNDSLKLKKNNTKAKAFNMSRRKTFVIKSAAKSDCKIDIQSDSEPENVSEMVLDNPADQGKVLNEIDGCQISSHNNKRRTFAVSSVVREAPELHFNEKQNQKSSCASEFLLTTFQEIELGSGTPTSGELKADSELKENVTSNDSEKRLVVDHPNIKQEKSNLSEKQSIQHESGVVASNVISPSAAASSVQEPVDTKRCTTNLPFKKTQHSVQNVPSECSPKQRSDPLLVEDLQPVDCFPEFQKKVDSKKLRKTRQSLQPKGTDVAAKKNDDFFPGRSKRRSLMVKSTEQIHHHQCSSSQIIHNVTMQQQDADISEKDVPNPKIKSPICMVKALEQYPFPNEDHKENIKGESGEEVLHLNEKQNQKASCTSESLQATFQEVDLGFKAPCSGKLKTGSEFKKTFTCNDSVEQIIADHPSIKQENTNSSAKQSIESESKVVVMSHVISPSAASLVLNLVDTKCCKANLPLEKTQTSEYAAKHRSDQLLVEGLLPVDCFLEFKENVDFKKLSKTRQSLRRRKTDVGAKKNVGYSPRQSKRSLMTESAEQMHHRRCRYDQIIQEVVMQQQDADISEKNMQMLEIKKSPICMVKTLGNWNECHQKNTEKGSEEDQKEEVSEKLKKINQELDILLSKPATVTPPFRGQIKVKPEKNRYNFSSKMSFARKQNKKTNRNSISSKNILSAECTVSSARTEMNFVKSVEVQNTELDNSTLFLQEGTLEKNEKMQIYSTEENNMQNAHERVASKSCHKTAQVKATKINDRNQTDSNSPQNLENQIGGEKVQSNGNDSPSSIHHFSMQSLERNSCLTREKMAPEKERKRKVKVPTENIENDTLDYLMQTVVKTEQPESVETQAPHGANALISKSIQLDDKEDKPLENDNKHSIRMQICQQDSVCLPELSEIQSCKIPIGDAVNNKEHNPMIKNNSTRPKGIKEKKRRTSSVVRAPRSKKVGSELKFKNAGKSTTPARKLGALKELNVPRNFEIFRETMETVVPNDVLISNNLKLFHSVKNVSKVDCEINCNSKKVSPKVGNRLAIEQNAMMPQSQTKNENHPTPSRETNHNSFIANQSLSPCVVHLVEEIVECDVDPKQCNKKDSMPVKKKSVKHKKNNRYSNIIKENVKPQSIKTLEKDKILTIADVHEPPDENINCEKNALANMQPSVVLNDILGGSQFSMLKKGLNENRKISPSHELPVPLNEKNSRRKILHEAVEPRGIPSRRTRKPVNYKEPSVHLKLRRT